MVDVKVMALPVGDRTWIARINPTLLRLSIFSEPVFPVVNSPVHWMYHGGGGWEVVGAESSFVASDASVVSDTEDMEIATR